MSVQEKLKNSGLRYGGLRGLPNPNNPYGNNSAVATAMQDRIQALGNMRNAPSWVDPVAVASNPSGFNSWMQGYQSQQMANASGATGPSAVSSIMNKAGAEVASMVAQDIAQAVNRAASAYTNNGSPRALGAQL